MTILTLNKKSNSNKRKNNLIILYPILIIKKLSFKIVKVYFEQKNIEHVHNSSYLPSPYKMSVDKQKPIGATELPYRVPEIQ